MLRSRSTWAPATVAALLLVSGCGGSKESAPSAPAGPGAASDAAAPAAEKPPLPPDEPVVEVSGVTLRSRRILQEIEMERLRRRAQGRALPPDAEPALRQAALDAFVANELLHQAAVADGVKATEAEIAAEVKGVRDGFPSEDAYRKFLADAELTDADIEKEAEYRLTVQEYMKKISAGQSVTEKEAKAFYDANADGFREAEKVRPQIIVVKSQPTDAEPLKADAKRRIEEARKRAVAGEDFAALAREYSQIPNARSGGDLGFFGRNENIMPKIEDMAFSTPVGQVSPVFETPTGLNFLKVLEKQPARIRPFDEVKQDLILEMTRLKEQSEIQKKIAELRQNADVKILDEGFLKPEPPKPAPAPN